MNEGRWRLSPSGIAHVGMRQETWKPNPSSPLNNSCTSIAFKHDHSILDTIPETYTALLKVQRQAEGSGSVLQLTAHSRRQWSRLWWWASTSCRRMRCVSALLTALDSLLSVSCEKCSGDQGSPTTSTHP